MGEGITYVMSSDYDGMILDETHKKPWIFNEPFEGLSYHWE